MEKTLTLAKDLHARPAAVFAQKAGEFPCLIFLLKDGKKINAKSIISILSLSAKQGDTITLAATGEQEAAAIEALSALLAGGT
ncbi:MAG: HPr family phosphocarrier protein [Sporomusaceae bacterium]|jgi:phosphotransferase system HPr (HPr) family protein|nr:HPr family phosphocarrier protein [Sporomusaceae bacterium]